MKNSNTKKRAKSLTDSSLTRDKSNQNLFHYHKIDRSDSDNPRITRNKYQLWVNKHQIYKDFSHVACNCYSYYKILFVNI